MTPKRTGCFRDEECTCECGNKHELYGGAGYKTVACEAYSDGKVGGGRYIHTVECNKCGVTSELVL
ncbi:hypothetical protein [Paenibacillus brasilensis]|uniref:Uncharacterized protein n=1 Tax=Paenibacillus brasilensis TaxID=128574 RepID=A0ABU0L7R5_9BACL|nr:hypothetical protein [Paenibacillus brasilensis]MDQ0497317.1 hypothetical protein [Paenibacillus brasilensis]